MQHKLFVGYPATGKTYTMQEMAKLSGGFVVSPYDAEYDEWPVKSLPIDSAVDLAKGDVDITIYIDSILIIAQDPSTRQSFKLFISYLENCKKLKMVASSQDEKMAIRLLGTKIIDKTEIIHKKRDWDSESN